MKRSSSMLAIIMAAIICATSVCPVLAAEETDSGSTTIASEATPAGTEESVEEEPEESGSIDESDEEIPEENSVQSNGNSAPEEGNDPSEEPVSDHGESEKEAADDYNDFDSYEASESSGEAQETEQEENIENNSEENAEEAVEEDVVEEDAAESSMAAAGDIIASGDCGATEDDHVTWMLTGTEDDMTLTISGQGSMANYDDINSIDKHRAPWYSYRSSIKIILIETGLNSIGNYAFSKCSNVPEIVIPGGVTSVGVSAFNACSSLTEIVIPDSVTSIGASAFKACSSLTEIVIPDSVTSIGGSAFNGCSSLTQIVIPNGVTVIKTSTFKDCESLTDIIIPNSVTTIENEAFNYCSNLTNITIPESVTDIGVWAFMYCYSLTDFIIPEGVTSINEGVFIGCKELTSITIPDSVSSIGISAFRGCESLKEISIPYSVTSIGTRAFYECSSLISVSIPDGVTTIGEQTFSGCDNLVSVSIPDTVTIIEDGAFSDCHSLAEISLPSGITSIEHSAFISCDSLERITLPNGLTKIERETFKKCSALSEIAIPEYVTSIEYDAFEACDALSTIWFYGDLPTIDGGIFFGVTATAYYPSTWDYVPSSTEFGGTITWKEWDPETGIIPGEVDVRDGYDLKSVSNEADGIRISIDSILESPETRPDGFYLLKKEENGTFNKVQTYRFDASLNSFGGAEYLDTDVEFGKQYTYALQAFKGSSVGKCGTEVTIRRVWRAEINEVYGYDWNRFPIYQTSNKDVIIQIYFAQNELPSYYLDTDKFKGTLKLTCLGKVVLTSGYGKVIYREKTDGTDGHYLEWTIEKEKLNKADLPANTNCTLSVYDHNGDIIAEQQLKTSFERLSFCNSDDDNILARDPGSIINKDKHVSKELLIDFFGKSKADWLQSKFKEPIGDNGLCFGMAVTTDQFQAGLLSSENLFSQDKLDLVDKENLLSLSSGQSEKMLNLVKRQQLYQFVVPFIIELENHNFDFSGLLDQIDAYNSGQSALMPVIWMEAYEGDYVGDYHAVLAYRYKRNPDDDGVTIYVYDPGEPYRTINRVELYIKITGLSSNPRWDYTRMPYMGNKNDAISHNTRFSWVIPDWDIYSDAIEDEHIMADISGDAFDEDIDTIRNMYPDLDIKVLNYGQAAGNPLVLIGGEGLIDLSGICSSISLAGNNCSYEVSGAQSLILDLGTTDSGDGSEYGIRSITVGGDSETTVSRTTVTDDGVITYKKTLDDTTNTIVLESNSAIESPSEVSGKFDSGADWYFDGETMTISGEGATPDYASFRDTPWYSFRNEIRKVVIEEGVTRIGSGAFCSTKSVLRREGDPKGVDSITSVQFPGSLQAIGDSAFENCNQIQEVILPDSMSGAIGKAAFYHCYSLRTLDLGTGVSGIGEAAFKGCNKIEDLVIPASVEEIEKGYGMDSNTATMLANPIPQTGAFADCTSLQEVTYESDADIEDFTFAGCESLRSFKVTGAPAGIGSKALYDCGSLSELTLPAAITSIGEYAFDESLDALTIYYGGTEEQWRAVAIDEGNDALNSAKIICQPKELTSAVTLSQTSFIYNGKAQEPAVTVKDGDVTLVNGTDYTVSYKNNINAGTAIVSTTGAKGTVTYSSSNAAVAAVDSKTGKVTAKKVGTVKITAKSAATANYNTAGKAVTIKVVPAATASLLAANQPTGIKLTWKKVAGANGYIIYRNGIRIKTITSGTTVTFSDAKANTNGTKYTYKVVAKATTGTSTLSRSLTTYRVARTAISSLASGSAGKMTVKWKRNSKANGYVVQYSKSKTFSSGNKTATITKNTLLNKTIGSLTKGKKYYVRVRCFKTVSGKKYYSGWSAVKAVTIK